MKLLALPLSLALAGCMTTPADTPPATGTTEPAPPAAGKCDAGAAARMVGMKATQELGARIQQMTGARTLRWGPPDTAWTMDYREDRVNVRYDSDMIITEITCG